MENIYLQLLQQGGCAAAAVTGNEGLSLSPVEGYKIRLKSLSLELDKKIAGMSGSIHTVEYNRAMAVSEHRQFLKKDSHEMPVPVNFDPKRITWDKYVKHCIEAVSLIDGFKTDSSRFYDWMRQIAAKGQVSNTFRYTVSSTAKQIQTLDGFIKLLGNPSRKPKRPLGELYPSFSEMFKTINEYNLNVKMIKARDTEIIAKQLKLNAELGEVLLERIKANDVVLTESDLKTLQRTFDEFEHYMNVVGAMTGLLNELSAVFVGQCKEVENF